MVTAVRPQWIAKTYAAKVGRDHLGLGSLSSDQILPSLSPSVNVLTYSSSQMGHQLGRVLIDQQQPSGVPLLHVDLLHSQAHALFGLALLSNPAETAPQPQHPLRTKRPEQAFD